MRTQSTMLTQLVSELKEKDYELKTIFNSTQNAIVIFDNNGLILNANPAAEAVIGIEKEATYTTNPDLVDPANKVFEADDDLEVW